MHILIVEDDLVSARLLREFLNPYGQCDLVSSGAEAIQQFHMALLRGQPYQLVCLDVMMPELSGHEVLKELRLLEEERAVGMNEAAKIIMTTALDDVQNVMDAFRSQCDAYLVKPIRKADIAHQLHLLGLLDSERS